MGPYSPPQSAEPASLGYRADIDGLRAVSILVVLFFHAGVPAFSGGFVGVDVFFVISGFLITSIIHKEVKAGQFSIARFYERRIRRIFPALFPVLAFTLVVAAVVFNPIDFKVFGESVTATTLFSSNILFLRQSGYFDAAATTKPLLHTWSLAVEEQFYIVFPLLLMFIHQYLNNKYLKLLIFITLASFTLNLLGMTAYRTATFYLVPTRAWELLFGSLLALGELPLPRSQLLRNLLSALGLGLIILAVAAFNESTPFPGAAALVPVLGASLVIYSGTGGTSAIGRILGVKPMVYVGLISYSLYLWHWPLLVFAKGLVFRDLTWLETTCLLLAAFAFSALSLRFVERPFRGARPILANRRSLFVLAAAVMLVACFAGSAIYLQNGMPYRNNQASAFIFNANKDPGWFGEEEGHVPKLSASNLPLQVGAKDVAPSFILWGDSHAKALIPAITIQSSKNGMSGFVATHNNYPPILGIDVVFSNSMDRFNREFNDDVISFITAHPELKTVILAGSWERYANGAQYLQKRGATLHLRDPSSNHSSDSNPALLEAGLTRAVLALRSLHRDVIIVSDVPDLGYGNDAGRIYWATCVLGNRSQAILPTLSEYRQRDAKVYAILDKLNQLPSVTVVFPESMMTNAEGRFFIAANSGLLYRDSNHLSEPGAEYLAPAFDQVFKGIAKHSTPSRSGPDGPGRGEGQGEQGRVHGHDALAEAADQGRSLTQNQQYDSYQTRR